MKKIFILFCIGFSIQGLAKKALDDKKQQSLLENQKLQALAESIIAHPAFVETLEKAKKSLTPEQKKQIAQLVESGASNEEFLKNPIVRKIVQDRGFFAAVQDFYGKANKQIQNKKRGRV